MNLFAKSLLFAFALLSGAAAQAENAKVEWIRQIGTYERDESSSVAVDAAGNVFVTGYTRGSLGGANAGGRDAFLAKFDSSGNELWTQQIGTPRSDESFSVAVDAEGNAYISGFVEVRNDTPFGSADALLTKFDGSGNVLWTEQIGANSTDRSVSVAVDAAGNAYISGYTDGSLGGGNVGSWDAFLTKFDNRGNQLWTEQIGTSGIDESRSVAVDATGNVYISGSTYGSLGGANAGSLDAFLAKFDSSGSQLWTRQIGSSSMDRSVSVAVDAAGNAYITGYTEGSLGRGNAGGADAFLTKFDSSGNELWTEQIGTSSGDISLSVAVDAAGNAHISGYTGGSLGGTNVGHWDAFLAKIDGSGGALWIEQFGTTSHDVSRSVALDVTGNIYISGYTERSLGGANSGDRDAFLIKYRIVPEPTAAVLAVVAGLAGLAVRRRGVGTTTARRARRSGTRSGG